MSDVEANKQLVRDFYAAFNRRDFDAVIGFYADGAKLDVVAAGRFGGEQVPSREVLAAFDATFPEIEFRIVSLLGEGDRVSAEVESRGTLSERRRLRQPLSQRVRDRGREDRLLPRVSDERGARRLTQPRRAYRMRQGRSARATPPIWRRNGCGSSKSASIS